MRVLLVEDEPLVREVILRMLATTGVEVDAAGTYGEAAGMIASTVYDLAVLDFRLPDGTGLDVLRNLMASQPRAQAILITGEAEIERIREEALALGAPDVLSKPGCVREIVTRVRSLSGPPPG